MQGLNLDGSLFTRYLPMWVSSQTRIAEDSNVEDALLRKWFDSAVPGALLENMVWVYGSSNYLSDMSLMCPTTAWVIDTNGIKINSMRITNPSFSDKEMRHCTTEADFIYALDPVYMEDSSTGLIYMRNITLTLIDYLGQGGPGDFGDRAIGSIDDYADATLFYSSSTTFDDIDRLIPGIDIDLNTGSIRDPNRYSDEWFLFGSSLGDISSTHIKVNGADAPFTRIDLWNVYDEWGLLAGVTRLPNESNLSMRDRIKTVFALQPGPREENLVASIARGVGLVGILPWDGVSTLDFASSGILDVTHVFVNGLPEFGHVYNQILAKDATSYISGQKAWEPSWMVYINGQKADESKWPYPTVTSGIVTFAQPVSGTVAATYTYRNYTLETTGSSAYLKATNNTSTADYKVVYTRSISLSNVADRNYQRLHLLASDGNPNTLFRDIVTTIKSDIPITLGSAKWSQSAHWFKDGEDQPKLSSIPLIYK